MEIHAYANHYLGRGVFIIWSEGSRPMNSFEILRNGEIIAYSKSEEETKKMFARPEMFDNDHSTNLFRKDSHHKYMFNDKDVWMFQNYTYEVIGRFINFDGSVTAVETTGELTIYYD